MKIPELTTTLRLPGWWKPKAANLLAVLYSVTVITALPFARALLLLTAALVTKAFILYTIRIPNLSAEGNMFTSAGRMYMLSLPMGDSRRRGRQRTTLENM